MTKDLRDVLLIWGAALIAAIGVTSYISSAVNAQALDCPNGIDKTGTACNCPDNTYRIGGTDYNPVCKNQPTGCSYGDSIPLDQCVDKSSPQKASWVVDPQPDYAPPIPDTSTCPISGCGGS